MQSLLNLCRPKETSSLEEVLRAPAGPLMAADDRPGAENFTPDVLLTFSEPLRPQNNEERKESELKSTGTYFIRAQGGKPLLPPSGSNGNTQKQTGLLQSCGGT